jgi:hypothetical protein
VLSVCFGSCEEDSNISRFVCSQSHAASQSTHSQKMMLKLCIVKSIICIDFTFHNSHEHTHLSDAVCGRCNRRVDDAALRHGPEDRPQGGGERCLFACLLKCSSLSLSLSLSQFRVWVEAYANDEQLFFRDFAAAFSKLLALGCPPECDPNKVSLCIQSCCWIDGNTRHHTQQLNTAHQVTKKAQLSASEEAGLAFREHAMHGSVGTMKKYRAQVCCFCCCFDFGSVLCGLRTD